MPPSRRQDAYRGRRARRGRRPSRSRRGRSMSDAESPKDAPEGVPAAGPARWTPTAQRQACPGPRRARTVSARAAGAGDADAEARRDPPATARRQRRRRARARGGGARRWRCRREPATAARERRIRTVDFSQPTKFSTELRQRIVRALGPFCEAFAMRLSSELRVPVELAWSTPSSSPGRLPRPARPPMRSPSPCSWRRSMPQMLLNIDLAMILRRARLPARRDGGRGPARPAPERGRLGSDASAARRTGHPADAAWRDFGGLELTLGEVDDEGDAGVVIPLGEPTFAVSLREHDRRASRRRCHC